MKNEEIKIKNEELGMKNGFGKTEAY